MTQSDNIVEFLKYASPRLDYIEHCMEKMALQKAIKRYAGKPGAKMVSSVAERAPKGTAEYATRHAARSAALSKHLMGTNEYADLVNKLVAQGLNRTQAARIVQKKLAKGLRANKQLGNKVPETMEQVRDAARTIRPVKYKHPIRNTSDQASNAASNAAEPGMWDNITAWVKEHPYLATSGGLAAGAAGGAGVGYGIGNGSGRQEGSQIAQRYYELREALDRQRLQRTNDSFLSRLGNLFGTGDLSGLIG